VRALDTEPLSQLFCCIFQISNDFGYVDVLRSAAGPEHLDGSSDDLVRIVDEIQDVGGKSDCSYGIHHNCVGRGYNPLDNLHEDSGGS